MTDATLGDAIRGCCDALYATVQGVLPALLSLWVIGPARFSRGTTALAVALSAFVVALPMSTHLVCRKIALGQIVIVYVVAFIHGPHMEVIEYPVHVIASTAVGALASVLALLFPYPLLAVYEVRKKCTLFADNALERLSLLVFALCAQDKISALSSLSQARTLSKAGTKILQSIKFKQGSIQWERPWIRFLQPQQKNPGERLQSLEIALRGMEFALTCCPSFPARVVDSDLKSLLQGLEVHISLALRHAKCSLPENYFSTATETTKEEVYKSHHTLKSIFPTYEDLPSFFFLFCMKLLYDESIMTQPNKFALGKNPVINTEERANSSKQNFLHGLMGILTGERLMFALKCSLSLGLAVLFGLIFSKGNGYWSGLTVAIGISSGREATLKVANLRAQGTVLGSIYGVLSYFLLQRFMAIRFLSLLPWIIFTSLLRHSRMYGQAGGIAAAIAALLILGRKNYGPPSEFAFARLVETFIGLFCYVLVEILLQPTRAATLAKIQLSQSLRTLYECIESISFPTNSILELKEKEEKLRIQVNDLGKFIEDSEAEPNFWFLPFHGACYNKLLESLSKMVELLNLGIHAMGMLQRESHRFGVAWKDLLENIEGDLDHFKKMIMSSVNCCEAVTSMKSLETLERELRIKNISCDIEMGKSPNGDEFKLLCAKDDEMEMIINSFLQNSKEITDKIHAVEGDEDPKSQAILCLSALGFCMGGLMKETREIAMGVKELVQWENPSRHVNLYEIYCKIQSTDKIL
ncbi:hypothetical protein NE237_010732 [Protea cynaroides]|uniref:Uncharacterized protein n=1 Tax=Protea cynaroides TaxID=273540 RepID=A0A9Q0L098_9MAGN|nr:hypothetical protein NE237_010732 [Protea cynaroides]